MGTFPAGYEYGTPIPQPQDGVASAPVPQISGVAAQTQYEAGANTKQTGQEVDQFGQQIEILQAQDAVNKLRVARDDLTYGQQNGFMKVKGGDVLNPTPDGTPMMTAYPARLKAAAADIGSGLTGRAAMMYRQKVGEEVEGYRLELLKHSMNETDVFHKSVFNDATQQAMTDSVRYSDQPAMLEKIAQRVDLATRNFAASQGLAPEAMAKGMRSNVFRAAMDDRIAKNDGPGALSLFRTYGKELDGKDQIDVGRAMTTVGQGEIARAYVGGLIGGGGAGAIGAQAAAGVKQSMQHWEADGYSRPVAAGMTAGFLRESQFGTTGAVNKGDGTDGSDSINIGQWNGARAVAFKKFAAAKGLSESDPQTGLLYAKAEIDGEIPYSVSGVSPGLKAKLQGAKDEKEAADIMTREYFKPRYTAGESTIRQGSATAILADANKDGAQPPGTAQGDSVPPAPVGDGTPVTPVRNAGPPGFLDTRQLTIDAETQHVAATRQNRADWSTNTIQMAANQHLIDVQFEGQKQVIELATHRLNKAVEDWVTTPGANGAPQTQRPPPEVWNQLTYEKQRSIDATLAHNAKGADRPTDMGTYYRLERMAGAQPVDFANVDLMQYYNKLSNADFQKLSGFQKTALAADPTAGDLRDKHAIVKDAAAAAGIKMDGVRSPDQVATANKFLSWVEDAARSWTAQNGRKPNGKEWQAIADDVTMKISSGSAWSGDKPIYELSIDDVPKTAQIQYMQAFANRRAPAPTDHDIIAIAAASRVGAVPQTYVPILAAELKKRGRAVTPHTLLGAWNAVRDSYGQNEPASSEPDDLTSTPSAAPPIPVPAVPVAGNPLPLDQRLPVPGIGPRPISSVQP